MARAADGRLLATARVKLSRSPWLAPLLGLLNVLERLIFCWQLSRAVFRLPQKLVSVGARQPSSTLTSVLDACLQRAETRASEAPPSSEERVLAIDVGGTRTKFLLVSGGLSRRLPPKPTAALWQNAALEGADKFEPHSAPARIRDYLRERNVDMSQLQRLVFSVPGTVDLEARRDPAGASVIKKTPSLSPKFAGFDFKEAFREVAPLAKVSALPDNLAAALGVACQRRSLRSALVIVLGTAPAVATLFRDPSGKGKYIETGIWQSWVWFTKVKLADPYGYCGGLRVTATGVDLKPPTTAKIPHHQARIRFVSRPQRRAAERKRPAPAAGAAAEEAAAARGARRPLANLAPPLSYPPSPPPCPRR